MAEETPGQVSQIHEQTRRLQVHAEERGASVHDGQSLRYAMLSLTSGATSGPMPPALVATVRATKLPYA
jgi:hypothetical protein